MNKKTVKTQSISKRQQVLAWVLLVAAGLTTLLYFEQIALIYVLATLFLVVLLLIVAFADLEKVGRDDSELTTGNNLPTEPTQNNIASEQTKRFG